MGGGLLQLVAYGAQELLMVIQLMVLVLLAKFQEMVI